jgi:hypothetical protein
MAFDLGNLLSQYLGGGNQDRAADDFDRVAQNAPRATVAEGVANALRSDQTPPFPQVVSQLFGQSDAQGRAGMLNQLLGSVNPSLLGSIAGGAFGKLFGGGQVTPEQAAQVSPEQVRELAEQAEQQNPGIVERMSAFYAEHPTLVKAIGGAALALALGHVAQRMRSQSTIHEGNDMGILSNIFGKIFPKAHAANKGPAAQAPAPSAPAAPAPQAQPQVQPQAQPQAAPAAMEQVDVEEILTNMQKSSGQQLNWRTSIVDLLKLLGLDSSLQARKELAAELHYTGDTGDSAAMNIWLHRQVMNKLAANGGKVPADLRD